MKGKDKYIEIEEIRLEGEVPQILRQHILTDTDAEVIYNLQEYKFGNHTAKVVEMQHDTIPSKNKPCLEFKIINGKVKR